MCIVFFWIIGAFESSSLEMSLVAFPGSPRAAVNWQSGAFLSLRSGCGSSLAHFCLFEVAVVGVSCRLAPKAFVFLEKFGTHGRNSREIRVTVLGNPCIYRWFRGLGRQNSDISRENVHLTSKTYVFLEKIVTHGLVSRGNKWFRDLGRRNSDISRAKHAFDFENMRLAREIRDTWPYFSRNTRHRLRTPL